MKLKYGSYDHLDNQAQVAISRSPIFDGANRRVRSRESWTITGYIEGSSQADFAAKIAAIEGAYEVEGQDLILYLNDGTTPSAHTLAAADCISGPHVSLPSWGRFDPIEYAAGGIRSYTIIATAEKTIAGAEEVVAFSETLSYKGGGPAYAWSRPMKGRGRKFMVREFVEYELTQQGTATGLTTWPTPPAPIYPSNLDNGPFGEVGRDSPLRDGDAYKDYTVSWMYVMTGIDEMVGDPNTWL